MAFNGLSFLLDIDLDGLGVYNDSQRHFNDHAYIILLGVNRSDIALYHVLT
jgi:hypothetical protein